jgi:hypothetical protein
MQRVYNETVGASVDAAFFGSGAVLAYSRTDVKPSSERESLYKTFPKNHSRNRTVTATPQLCLRDCFRLRDFVLNRTLRMSQSQRVADGAISTRSCVLPDIGFNTLTNAHSSLAAPNSTQTANRR